ncbi:MAG: hypothetical protein OXR67_01810 [Chloroflexota bacterium]|nr:hypothetical protein [Chloroflexota bacterium]MDE2937644.1 hypothetical protein [Chloroflexota bacterium]
MSEDQLMFLNKQDKHDFEGGGFFAEVNTEWLEARSGVYFETDNVAVVPVPETSVVRGKASHVRYTRNSVTDDPWRIESYFLV